MLIYALMYTPNKEQIKHVLPFEFHRGSMASSAAAEAKTLKDTCANDVVNEKTCRRWFSSFKKDDFSQKDEKRTESRKLKNPILSNCKLPLMKIQLALLENRTKPLT
ncbi:hypothetical protein ACTXT7_014385 [Hymenolepis weldensis]